MKNIIEITDTASQRIKDIISKADSETLGLRIAVKSGGCAGYSYDMDYIKEVIPTDE
ncbi:MAG: HesB/IscA family protein, partial [Candidatus Pelagibacterales bacterium]